MAGNQYELRIVIDDGTSTTNNQIAGDNTSKAEPKTKKEKSLTAYVATRAIKPFLQQTTAFLVNNVELTTGSTELQQRVDFAMQSINTGANIISGVTAGFAVAGPVGAVVGGAVSVFNTLFQYQLNQTQININSAIEDRQIAYLTTRAGPAFNQSRRGA